MARNKAKPKFDPSYSKNRMSEEEIERFLSKDGNGRRFRRRSDYIANDEFDFRRNVEVHEAGHAALHAESSTKGSAVNRTPPAIAELISYATTKPRLRDAVIGSRSEIFSTNIDLYGRDRAVRLYWMDTVISIWPFLKGGVKFLIAGDILHRWWRS